MRRKYWKAGLCAASLALYLAVPVYGEGMIPEGIYVDEISLGGMSAEEASQAIQEYVDSLAVHKITLDIENDKADTTAGELGLFWNNQEEIQQILAEYQGGNLIKRYINTEDLKAAPMTLSVETSVSQDKVKEFIDSKTAGLIDEPVDASMDVVDGEA